MNKLNKKNIIPLITKFSSSLLSIYTPYYFINQQLSQDYGLIILNIAIFKISIGWLISSNKKLLIYSERFIFPSFLKLNLILNLFIIIGYFILFRLTNSNNYILGLLSLPVVLESILLSFLERFGDISLSVFIKSSLIFFSGFLAKIISDYSSNDILKIWILAYTFLIFLIFFYWKLFLFKNEKNLNSFNQNQSKKENLNFKNFIKLSYSYWLGELDIILSTESPILICGMIFGPDMTSKYSLIKTIIKSPCIMQGFTNPYSGYKLREMFSLKIPFNKIKKYFYKQTFYNSIGALIIFVSIFLFLKIYQIYDFKFLSKIIDSLIDYEIAILFSSLAFVIVALMGPITNILLCMRKQKVYGFITFSSSILGIPIQFIISKFFGFEGFLLSTTFSAMVSNIASRIILERFPYKRGT